jgi:hypothetical protein
MGASASGPKAALIVPSRDVAEGPLADFGFEMFAAQSCGVSQNLTVIRRPAANALASDRLSTGLGNPALGLITN